VHASFQELTHCEICGHCHFLSGLCLGGDVRECSQPADFWGFLPQRPKPHLRSNVAL